MSKANKTSKASEASMSRGGRITGKEKLKFEIDKQLRQIFIEIQPFVRDQVRKSYSNYVRAALNADPFIQELRNQNSMIVGELGLVNSTGKIDGLIEGIIQTTKINTSAARGLLGRFIANVSGRFTQTISLEIGDTDILFNQDFAIQPTEKGAILPWLQWLMVEGDNVVVAGYDAFTNERWIGRSGTHYLMAKGAPNNFQVDPSFRGTPNDNIVRNALVRNRPLLEQEILNGVTKVANTVLASKRKRI